MAVPRRTLKAVPPPAAPATGCQDRDPSYQALRLRGLAQLIDLAGDQEAHMGGIDPDIAFFLGSELRQIADALDGRA